MYFLKIRHTQHMSQDKRDNMFRQIKPLSGLFSIIKNKKRRYQIYWTISVFLFLSQKAGWYAETCCLSYPVL